jgi:HEAT repeat protein
MGGTGVETSLIHLTEQGKPEVRTAVINILAERSTPTSTTALLKAAGGSDSRVASTAIKALGRTAGVEQAPALTQILVETKADDVRDAAQSAIVAIAQRSGDRNRAAEPLLTAMDHASDPGKVALIGALAEVGGDRALDVITRSVRSSDADVRNAALAGLANTWSDSRALSPLMDIAKNSSSRSDRVQALRGYLRLTGMDDRASSETRLTRIREAMAAAERPEEKRQALSVLRDIRSEGAVELAAKSLDDPDLVAEASDAIIYLAAPQKKNNNNLQAVRGQATDSALDKVIRTVKDDNIRAQARKLREG